jgi:hypothetical protein
MVLLRKFSAPSNSSSNSLLFCYCSKTLVSSVVDALETSGSTYITLVNWTYSTFFFSVCYLLKALAFLSTSFFLASYLSLSKAPSLMAPIKMKKWKQKDK